VLQLELLEGVFHEVVLLIIVEGCQRGNGVFQKFLPFLLGQDRNELQVVADNGPSYLELQFRRCYLLDMLLEES
jgi:hypothetical protein